MRTLGRVGSLIARHKVAVVAALLMGLLAGCGESSFTSALRLFGS